MTAAVLEFMNRGIYMTDNEFIFYWFATFFIWNIYYLWIVPKRSAQYWALRFDSKEGQQELVKIARGIIDQTVQESTEALEESLESFKKSFFGSIGKNVQETKQIMKMANPGGDLLEKIGDQNPILGLIMQKLAPQLDQLGVPGPSKVQDGFKKGL